MAAGQAGLRRQLAPRTKSKVQLDYLNKHRATLSKICTLPVYLLSTQPSTSLWNNTACSCKHPLLSDTLSADSYRHDAQLRFQDYALRNFPF